MLTVNVLGGSIDPGRDGDFDQAQSMVGMSTVLEYPYPQRADPDRFSLGQVDYFKGHEGSLGLEEVTNLVGFDQDLSDGRFGFTLAAKDTL